jgi:hypothetical protein
MAWSPNLEPDTAKPFFGFNNTVIPPKTEYHANGVPTMSEPVKPSSWLRLSDGIYCEPNKDVKPDVITRPVAQTNPEGPHQES